MVFSSIEFIIFFCCVICIVLITKLNFIKQRVDNFLLIKFRHIFLLISSYIFYGWWDWRFCFLMMLLTLISFICAKQIETNYNNKFFKVIGILTPLIILGFFKYYNFFIESFSYMFNVQNLHTINVILPVGISFYSFQSLSYIIDVSNNKISSCSFIDLSLYISFFPQLVAGPIVKASTFLPQLKEERNISIKNFEIGIQIFVFGLSKKILIADNLSIFVDDVFSTPLAFSSITILLAVISYSIQIYFDFSGYSDMAKGCAKCLGYDFNDNFNMPYISRNLSEFWKRWHISLSSWLQEYLYIPLGGNRKGIVRTYINLLLTMIIGGLWHGASWTFVIWGTLHGVGLCIHKAYSQLTSKYLNSSSHILVLFYTLITYGYVCICWIFFRANSIETAIIIITKLFNFSAGINHIYSYSIIAIIIVLGSHLIVLFKIRFFTDIKLDGRNGYYPIVNLNSISGLTIFFLVVGVTLGLAYTGNNPFIYFQF